jgi:hypothetical protein
LLQFARRKVYRPSAAAFGADLHGIDEVAFVQYGSGVGLAARQEASSKMRSRFIALDPADIIPMQLR